MVRNSQLNKIEKILVERFMAPNQSRIDEVQHGNVMEEFEMHREVSGDNGTGHIIYRFDPDKEQLFPYFQRVEGLGKICDYIIFAENDNQFFVFLVEMKRYSTSGSPLKQLMVSESFARFILQRAEACGFGIEKEVHFRKIGVKDSDYSRKEKETIKYYENLEYDKNGVLYLYKDMKLRLAWLMDLPTASEE